jgi:hypothetical protein
MAMTFHQWKMNNIQHFSNISDYRVENKAKRMSEMITEWRTYQYIIIDYIPIQQT